MFLQIVMPSLEPGIQATAPETGLDCRVEPGNDAMKGVEELTA